MSHRADGEGSGGVVGPLKTGPLPTFWADGAGPIGRPPDPSGGGAPRPLGQRFGPPLRGALLQHLPPLAQFCQGDGPQLWPLTAPPVPDCREGTPGPLTVSGGQPTAYRALPGGRYPRAVCTAPGGHGSTPGGLAVTKTKPHAGSDSMRFRSPGALYNRSGVTGPPWVYRDYSLCGRHSAGRRYRHHQHTISVWLCQAPFFDVLRRPQESAPGARRGGAGPGARGPRSGARAAAQTAPGGPLRPTPAA